MNSHIPSKLSINSLPPKFNIFLKNLVQAQDSVDIASGIALGAAFTTLITAIIENTVTPGSQVFMSLLNGSKRLNAFGAEANGFMTYTVRGIPFKIGKLIQAFVIFLAIIAILHYVVIEPLTKLKKALGIGLDTKSPCPYCITQISSEAIKCPSCTSQLVSGWSTNQNQEQIQKNVSEGLGATKAQVEGKN
jgi:large conductance mechanosensitive channel